MKRIIISLAFALFAFNAFAQPVVEAGVNFGGYNKEGFTPGVGYFANALYDFSVGNEGREKLFIETGLGIFSNNAKIKDSNSKSNALWLKVPVYFGSNFRVNGGYLTAGVGLYYAYGIFGKLVADGGELDIMHNSQKNINIFKPHDFGWSFKFGFLMDNGLGFILGDESGFLNLSAKANSEAKNRVVHFGITYKF